MPSRLIDGQLTGRQFHTYLQPQRKVDWGAQRVHGISDAMLVGKPLFSSKAAELLEFLRGSEMVAHNATFDVGFWTTSCVCPVSPARWPSTAASPAA